MRGGIERFHKDCVLQFSSAPWWEIFYAGFYIIRLVVHDVFHYNYFLKKSIEFNNEIKKSEDILVNIIKEHYVRFAREKGIQLTVVLIPFATDIQSFRSNIENLHKKLLEIPDIKVISLLPCMYEYYLTNDKQIYSLYWPVDGHCTPQGYSVIAKCLFDELYATNATDN